LFAGQSRLLEIYFDDSTILGTKQHLPDGLFKGLTSLVLLSVDTSGLRKLPNMDDLTALTQFKAYFNQVGGGTPPLHCAMGE